VEQVIAEVADRARNAQGVEEKLGDLPHQATVVSAWLARLAAVAAPDGPHGAEAGGQGRGNISE
jgi:hypothetical protein